MYKSSFFYLKTIIRNPLMILNILFITFLISRTISSLDYSIFEFIKYLYFAFMSFNLFLIVSTTSLMSKKYEIFTFLDRNLLKKQISVIIASFIISLPFLAAIIIVIFIFKNNLTEPNFLLNAIIHLSILWSLTTIFSAALGTSIGIWIRNKFAVIIALVLYILFIAVEYLHLVQNMTMRKLFSIYDDTTFILTNNLSGILLNKAYMLDKLFVIFFLLVIMFTVHSFIAKKHRLLYSLIAVISMITMLIVTLETNKSFKTLSSTYTELTPQHYVIKTYEMELELNDVLQNNVSIAISILEDSDQLEFMLDDIFSVKSVEVNDNEVQFKHQDGILYIDSVHKKGDTETITIDYEGIVNIEDNLGFNTYYVTNHAINLPDEAFYWYPKTLGSEDIQYTVNLHTSTTVYSNLTAYGKSNVTLEGKARGVSLFAGMYKKQTIEGIEFIIPTTYQFENVKEEIEYIIQDPNITVSEAEMHNLKHKNYKRVMIGIWSFDNNSEPFQLDGDTLIIKYKDFM